METSVYVTELFKKIYDILFHILLITYTMNTENETTTTVLGLGCT